MVDLKRRPQRRLFGGRLRRLCRTVNILRTLVSEFIRGLSEGAGAVVEPPRPTAALRTDLPEPSESRSEAGGVPGLEGPMLRGGAVRGGSLAAGRHHWPLGSSVNVLRQCARTVTRCAHPQTLRSPLCFLLPVLERRA